MLASLSEEQKMFLQSFRKNNSLTTDKSKISSSAIKNDEVEKMETNVDDKSGKKVKFNEEIEIKEITSSSNINEDELPIHPKEAKKWLHMDKVNYSYHTI